MIDSRDMVTVAAEAADDKKAREITLIEVEKVSTMADYFMVCTGNSTTQVKAIAEAITSRMEEEGFPLPKIEGGREGRWVLLDYGPVVIHVMLEQEREFYGLERLWKTGRIEPWQSATAVAVNG